MTKLEVKVLDDIFLCHTCRGDLVIRTCDVCDTAERSCDTDHGAIVDCTACGGSGQQRPTLDLIQEARAYICEVSSDLASTTALEAVLLRHVAVSIAYHLPEAHEYTGLLAAALNIEEQS